MKKRLYLCIILIALFFSAKASGDEFLQLANASPNRVSQDGKYIVGLSLFTGKPYFWNLVNNQRTEASYGTFTDVNDSSVAAGYFTYNDFPIGGTTKKIRVAGIWENNSWTSLGIGSVSLEQIGNESDGSIANCISEDNRKVGGALIEKSQTISIPHVWTKNDAGEWELQSYTAPLGKPARIMALSGDGSLAVGWSSNASNSHVATIWTSPTDYILANKYGPYDEARHISPNGKYVAMTSGNQAVLYYMEENRFETIPIPEDAQSSGALSVSNDGTVVGFVQYVTPPEKVWRYGFVYSKTLGLRFLADYIDMFAPDINTGAIDFRSQMLTVPTTISANGKVIAGWYGPSSTSQTTWILKMPEEPPVVFKAPQNLQVDVLNHQTVTLTWDAPENMPGYTLTGYRIYRNNELIGSTTVSVRNYTHEDDVAGTHIYAVAACYEDYVSPKAEVSVEIYKVSLPLFDDFESGSFSTNFWKIDPANAWIIQKETDTALARGLSGRGATFPSSAQKGSYSLISKDLSAKNDAKIYLKFALKYFINNPTTSKEKLYVEVQTGSDWESVKSYDASAVTTSNKTNGWCIETIDLSSKVSGKEFKVRFRVQSENPESNKWDLDNVRIDIISMTNELAAPKNPVGLTIDNTLNLTWKSITNVNELTYFNGICQTATGNEGNRFIAANVFDDTKLTTPYLNRYLSSVTVYINQDMYSSAYYRLGLFVLYGNNKIYREIDAYVPNAWNTFLLDTPLLLNEAKDLIFGIDVIEHQQGELVIGNDDSGIIDINGNCYSTDNGAKWQKLYNVGVRNNWAIIGDITDDNTDIASERDESFLGYIIYRNGQPISRLLYQSKYADAEIDPQANLIYTVSAYYNNGLESALSDPFELNPTGAPTITEEQGTNVYPNPSSDFIRISGSFSKATLIDSAGKPVLETTKNPVSIAYLPSGIYLLKIESGTQVTICKVLKK